MCTCMKTFLYLIEADLTSGASICGFELVKRLKGSGFRPIVITQHKNDFNDACNQLGIENYHFHYARICSLGMGFIGWLIAYFTHPFLNFFALKYLEKKINLRSLTVEANDGFVYPEIAFFGSSLCDEEEGICIGFRDKKFLGIDLQNWIL